MQTTPVNADGSAPSSASRSHAIRSLLSRLPRVLHRLHRSQKHKQQCLQPITKNHSSSNIRDCIPNVVHHLLPACVRCDPCCCNSLTSHSEHPTHDGCDCHGQLRHCTIGGRIRTAGGIVHSYTLSHDSTPNLLSCRSRNRQRDR